MTAPSAARLLDPLSEQEAISSDPVVSVATARPSERMVPAVTATHGAQAVAIVRAGGFIAAIEPVPSELAEGTVIEQEPPAGAPLKREGVITLRLATPIPHIARAAIKDEALLASEEGAPLEPDDTEVWFEELALGTRDALPARAPARRSRKHRRPRPPAHELLFDPAPAPSGGPIQLGAVLTPLERTRRRASMRALITSAIFAVSPSLAGLTWRRASALLAGLLLLAFLGMRLFASSDRRLRLTDHRALGRSSHAQVPAQNRVVPSPPLSRARIRSPHRQRAGHLGPRETSHSARTRTGYVADAPTVATGPARQPRAAAAPTAVEDRSVGGQFAYLGQ
jgi:hypothetical protein